MHDRAAHPQWFWNLDTSLFYLFITPWAIGAFPNCCAFWAMAVNGLPFGSLPGHALSLGYSLALLFDKEFLTEALAAIDRVPVIRNGAGG